MERKYYLNPGNCIVCCLTCICFLILSAAMLTTSRYGTVLIFAATGIFFGGLAVFFGITISHWAFWNPQIYSRTLYQSPFLERNCRS